MKGTQPALKDALVGLGAIAAVDLLLLGCALSAIRLDIPRAVLLGALPVLLVIAVALPTLLLVRYLRRRGLSLGFDPLGRRGWHLVWQTPLVIVGAGVCAALVGPLLGITPGERPDAGGGGGSFVLLSLAAYLLLAPFVEEVVFRRLLMGYLDTTMPAVLSVLLSSLAFGLAHIAPPVIVFATFLGIGCALVTRWHQSLWAGLIVHMANNALVQLVVLAGLA